MVRCKCARAGVQRQCEGGFVGIGVVVVWQPRLVRKQELMRRACGR
jgi:hypothetical protein